jgi:hypothetical protein
MSDNRSALKIVQKFFPGVESVSDAPEPIIVEVTKADNRSAKVKNHKACAMAVACKRSEHADGVIVSLTRAYVIKGNQAVRYSLPESVAREVVSFDREAGFDVGEYHLGAPGPAAKLGAIHTQERKTAHGGKKIKYHKTGGGIRTVLGSKEGRL